MSLVETRLKQTENEHRLQATLCSVGDLVLKLCVRAYKCKKTMLSQDVMC